MDDSEIKAAREFVDELELHYGHIMHMKPDILTDKVTAYAQKVADKQTVDGWREVTNPDDLPKDDGTYLVQTLETNKYTAHYIAEFYNGDVGPAFYIRGDVPLEGCGVRIVAWMSILPFKEQQEATTMSKELSKAMEALELYRDICIECCMNRSNHDENGQVDMMDEFGMMICGNPKYPADEILKELQGKE